MQYRSDRYGNRISILGYGCMRFTQTAGIIDIKKTEKEILEAYNGGVNYFDTAYIYPGSEAALGEILERNGIRDKVNIATKLPHYMIKKIESAEKYFEEELKRLRTDYVDYYLMHMLSDVKTWERLVDLGLTEWLEEKKKNGQIKQVGFSFHGNSETFCKLLDVYDWDFCQIQYNYMDVHSQAGVTGLKKANEKGIPVIIMEPLRGGKLANGLPKGALKAFDEFEPKRSPAEWAFRWLWNQKEVTCVLSGMNSLETVRENVTSADNSLADMFGENEYKLFDAVVREINRNISIPCTGCRYCMPCPMGIDIPGTFAAYNRRKTDGKLRALIDYFMITGLKNKATKSAKCIECGKCESHCPQGIKIRQELKTAKGTLEGPIYKAGKKIFSLFFKY